MTAAVAPRRRAAAPAMTAVQSLLCPYQAAWVRDESPIKIWSKARRIGADYAEALRAVLVRLRGSVRRDYWYAAQDESAAEVFIGYVRDFAERMGRALHVVTDADWVDGMELRRMHVDVPLPGGGSSRITAMTSNPARFRSKGGDVTFSELAYHPDPEAMYKAGAPATARGGQLSIISTHNGEGSYFCRLLRGAQRWAAGSPKAGDIRMRVHETYIEQAVHEGLVERINRVEGTRFTREAWLVAERAKYDEATWSEEFLGLPSADGDSYFPFSLTRPCVDPAAPSPTDALPRFLEDVRGAAERCAPGPLFAGVDIARKIDRFVIWVGAADSAQPGARLRTAGVLVLAGAPFPVMQACGDALLRGCPRLRRMVIDATGIGAQLGEAWETRFGARAEAVVVTAALKAEVYPLLRRVLEERLLTIPDDGATLADLASVRREVTVSGHVRYAGERTEHGHADRACAAALLCHAQASRAARARVVALPPGGGGWR